MSNSVKTKFAGMLRGILRRLDDNEAVAPQTPRPVTVTPHYQTPAAPAAPVYAEAPAPVAPMTAPAPAAAGVPADNPNELQLPLQPILATLPMELRAKVIQTPAPGAVISLPLEKILTQLAFGVVKITFGELRHAAPNLFVNSGGEHDPKPVTLPLNEILPRLNPARLARRAVQRHMEVAEDISGPFGPGAQGVQISANTKPTPSTTLTQRAHPQSLRMVAPVAPAAPAAPTPVAPPPPAFVPRTVTPAAAAPPPASMSHDTTTFVARISPPPHSNGTSKPAAPVVPPSIPDLFPVPGAQAPVVSTPIAKTPPVTPIPIAPKPPVAPAPVTPVPVVPAPVVPAPATPAPVDATAVAAPLAALSEQWPEGLRLEIIQSDLARAQVLLPANLIEPALKRGRVTFTWRNLRPLIQPTPPPPSVHDAIELELPLSVIAPLFFARHKAAPRPQPRQQPAGDIPNLFFGFPQSESPPAKMPEPPAARPMPEPQAIRPAPEVRPVRPLPETQPLQSIPEPLPMRPATPPPLARPPVKPVDARISDSNYYIWGDDSEAPHVDETEYKRKKPSTDFTHRRATPKEIVDRAMALGGVAGVVVALPDGLRVASQVPADFNADTLAAFLPQIFDRVSQSTRELRMGALNNFNFTVGNVPWRIFRVNAVYFAAFGNAGEALPSAQLAALAAELDRKK